MIKRYCLPFACLLALLLGLAAPVSRAQLLQLASSPESAAEKARQETGGRVLSVQPSGDPARPGYLVKLLLQDGRVITKVISKK